MYSKKRKRLEKELVLLQQQESIMHLRQEHMLIRYVESGTVTRFWDQLTVSTVVSSYEARVNPWKDIAEDEDLTDEEKTNGKCVDLAKQFDLEKDPIDIAFGGGWRYFCPIEDRVDGRKCKRLDKGRSQNIFPKYRS